MAPAHPLSDLSVLDQFLSQPLPPGFSPTRRRFYSPVDDVPGALAYIINCAQRSLVVAMYGFDTDKVALAVKTKLVTEMCAVQLTLDSSQAGGVHEKALLAQMNYPKSSIAVGRSEKGAIMHLKEAVIDGVITVDGSTNWSGAGETLQDNSMEVMIDPIEGATMTARIMAIHNHMLQATR